MSARLEAHTKSGEDELGSRISSVPLLGEGFSENGNNTFTPSTNYNEEQDTIESPEVDAKTGKRRFWGLGKKKEDEKAKKKRESAAATSSSSPTSRIPEMRPTSPMDSPKMGYVSSSSHNTSHPYGTPSSPSRNIRSSSPLLSSPASSQIFERNVQEDGFHTSTSPAIPAHINTENHIPPVLDSASAAITDDHLNPDKVEIVMHSAHQPAAVTVTGTGINEAPWQDDSIAHPDNDDAASNYGALDANDVRRLSFISFADVVHAEHTDHGGSRDPVHLSGAAAIPPSAAFNRSPSPVRSPTSSHGLGGAPPLSGSVFSKGQETSSNYGVRGPGSQFPSQNSSSGGELTIETMRQALRKTGSGDLSGARSQPISAAGDDGVVVEHPFK